MCEPVCVWEREIEGKNLLASHQGFGSGHRYTDGGRAGAIQHVWVEERGVGVVFFLEGVVVNFERLI